MYRKHQPGGSVKAEGLGDGPAHGKVAIAKLRLTLPPIMFGHFAFALLSSPACIDNGQAGYYNARRLVE